MRFVKLAAWCLLASCSAAPSPAPRPAPQSPPPAATASATASPDPEPWRTQRPPEGAPSTLHFPKPEQATLPSGLSLFVVKRAVPVASLTLVFRHGASACPPGKSGLAALTARLLTEGTRRRPGVKLAEAVEQLGTTLDDDAGRDTSSLSLSALTGDVEQAIDLLGEVVTEPAFSPADFQRVQAEWLDGLRAERQAPARLASLAALGTLLGKPHGSPVNGSLVDVGKLTLKDIVEFHRRAYGAGDAALIVVGDVELERVRAAAERAFARLGKGESGIEQPFSPPPTPPGKRVLLIDRPGAVQSALMLAELAPKRSEPGYERRELLTTLFGGLFTSRLNLNLREEHAYTYGAHAQNAATRHFGAFYMTTSVRTDVTAEALTETLKELRALREPSLGKPITDEEVARARADLVQSVGARLEYGARIGGSLSDLWLHGLPLDYFAHYPALLARETPATLGEAAKSLDPERLVIVVVGDRAVVGAPISALGFQVVPAAAELLE